MTHDKSSLRATLRERRRALPPHDHAARSRRAAAALAAERGFKAGARLAAYLPVAFELDTAALLAAARRRGVRVYVPVVIDRRRRRIEFRPLDGRLRRGAYGIPVPERAHAALGARWFDLVAVPLVGVDRRGRRLGMGGGYYDRAFAFRRLRRTWRGPRLVGLAFDCQRVDSIGAEAWDLGLDALATESGLTDFGGHLDGGKR
ncbi:MAG: 5-formyltetrahydrofolate cyclo-ligase [Gammaproteobacteria bacterium]|nr:5-formyltetrahydrofolate cyclo-ligase [Gammaproteobacteria bacterium]